MLPLILIIAAAVCGAVMYGILGFVIGAVGGTVACVVLGATLSSAGRALRATGDAIPARDCRVFSTLFVVSHLPVLLQRFPTMSVTELESLVFGMAQHIAKASMRKCTTPGLLDHLLRHNIVATSLVVAEEQPSERLRWLSAAVGDALANYFDPNTSR
jgi:hypothetical protein